MSSKGIPLSVEIRGRLASAARQVRGAAARAQRGLGRHPTSDVAKAIWENFPGQLAVLDEGGRLVAANPAWRNAALAFGRSPGANLLRSCDRAAAKNAPGAAETATLLRETMSADRLERASIFAISGPAGCRWLRTRAVPLADHSGTLLIREDVTAEKQRELDLRHRAFHDSLTGLPNRAVLIDRLMHAIAVAKREQSTVAVLFIDLDEFKAVNDQFGHLAGDTVLCQTGRRLAECVRTSDTVGRWGGDEFLIIAEALEGDFTAEGFARRVADQLQVPMRVADRSLSIHASIGVAVLAEDTTAEQLIESADQALMRVREHRRNAAV